MTGQVCPDQIACGMVRAHGRGGVGHAVALHAARVIGGNALIFNRRYPGVIEMPAHRRRSVADNFADLASPGDFLQHVDGSLGVAKLFISCVHGHAHGNPGVHGVQADVITQKVQPGNSIQIRDAGHTAHGPDGLVLQRCRDVLSVWVHVLVGTVDNAAGASLVSGAPAAFGHCGGQGLAGDFVTAFQLSFGGVITGESAQAIDRADQPGRTHRPQHLTGKRILGYSLGHGLGRVLEGV